MEYLIILLLINATAIIHELGHAVAMWKNRLAIEEIALGWPVIPIKLSISLSKFRIFGFSNENLKLSIYPLLIGAFVEPRNNKLFEELPAAKKIGIYWAGPFANLSIGLWLFLVYIFLLFRSSLLEVIIPILITALSIFLLEMLIFLPYLTTKFKRRKMSFLVPAYTIIFLGVIIWVSISVGDITKNLIGLVGIIFQLPKVLFGLPWKFFFGFVILMISIGLFNALPIPPLDGGKIMLIFLQEKGLPKSIAAIANGAGLGIILGVIILVTVKDIIFFILR